MLSEAVSIHCPYCGEETELDVDDVGVHHEDYIEDCPVCCRPWMVLVDRKDEQVEVRVERSD
jgi:hypothetical protein